MHNDCSKDAKYFLPPEASALAKKQDRKPENTKKQAIRHKVDDIVSSASTLLELYVRGYMYQQRPRSKWIKSAL
jgi:hypothetical protein